MSEMLREDVGEYLGMRPPSTGSHQVLKLLARTYGCGAVNLEIGRQLRGAPLEANLNNERKANEKD